MEILSALTKEELQQMIQEATDKAVAARLDKLMAPAPEEESFLDWHDMCKMTGYGKTALHNRVKSGDMPPPIVGGGEVCGCKRYWRASDVRDTLRLGSWQKVLQERGA